MNNYNKIKRIVDCLYGEEFTEEGSKYTVTDVWSNKDFIEMQSRKKGDTIKVTVNVSRWRLRDGDFSTTLGYMYIDKSFLKNRYSFSRNMFDVSHCDDFDEIIIKEKDIGSKVLENI